MNTKDDGSLYIDESVGGTDTRLAITTSGDVGIGTTSPDEKLHVYGKIKLTDASSGAGSVGIDPSGLGGAGVFTMNDDNGTLTVYMAAAHGGSGGGADIRLYRRDGGGNKRTIHLDADYGGNGRITTDELAITGGADLSEQFDVDGEHVARPGMVVSIDSERPGKLLISNEAYDNKVAGIISGAGGIKPGMMMGQKGSEADGGHPVALTGRVYCWADASNGSIEPGDLLTTSDTPGHAMKVYDHSSALGAIIGKAMTPLKSDRGLVLVLVSLQ
jgi:hypothetical protein